MNPNGSKSTFKERMENLPEGSFIEYNGKPYVISQSNRVIGWTPFGYTDFLKIPLNEEVDVLTPKSIVNTFRAGYLPRIHESAR
jgi:hypothetical protein